MFQNKERPHKHESAVSDPDKCSFAAEIPRQRVKIGGFKKFAISSASHVTVGLVQVTERIGKVVEHTSPRLNKTAELLSRTNGSNDDVILPSRKACIRLIKKLVKRHTHLAYLLGTHVVMQFS